MFYIHLEKVREHPDRFQAIISQAKYYVLILIQMNVVIMDYHIYK